MADDDIIPLRHSYALSMVGRISELEAEVGRLTDHNCEVATGYVQLLDHHTATRLERDRLRAALDSLLADIDTDHTPDATSRMCRTCGAGDGSWPCVHRMALDELKEARRG